MQVIDISQAWPKATCRYEDVPSGGVRSLLVGQRLMEISVSCALKTTLEG